MKTSEQKREYQRAYYLAHKERKLAWQRTYNAVHREEKSEWQRAYYAANREMVSVRDAKYMASNREKILERRRAHYAANRERLLAEKRTYYAMHREQRREYERAYQRSVAGKAAFANSRHRRRARRQGGATAAEVKQVLAAAKCHICGRRFSTENPAVLDHVIPLAKGGLHVASNLAAAHAICNAEKWAHTMNPKTGQRILL